TPARLRTHALAPPPHQPCCRCTSLVAAKRRLPGGRAGRAVRSHERLLADNGVAAGVRSAVLVCLACDCPRPGEAGGGQPAQAESLSPNPRVLLTKRSTRLTSFSGQVSFPGGKSDPGADAGPVATALREAAEEIGLSPGLVRVLAVLPVMPLGRAPRDARLSRVRLAPNPDEVDELLTPLLRWALPDGGRRVGRWLDCDIPVLSLRPGLAVFGFTCHLLVLAACICHRRYPLYPLEPFCHGLLLLLGLLVGQGLLLPDP
uniref:Nudix hydrolase domain-containing protein n=1 Tax=Macrostomum lignano TaxID=282301 RepID=A0A1I8FD79_9PLAT